MKKLAILAALATVVVAPAALANESSQSVRAATEGAGAVEVDTGTMLYSSSGHRIASVYGHLGRQPAGHSRRPSCHRARFDAFRVGAS